MAGTWEKQDKILPSLYVNFKTNAPLSITVGDRGTAVILIKDDNFVMDVNGGVFTADEFLNNVVTPVIATPELYEWMVKQAKANAKEVKVGAFKDMGTNGLRDVLDELALTDVDTIAVTFEDNGTDYMEIEEWLRVQNEEEGRNIVAVFGAGEFNSEYIINIGNAVYFDGEHYSKLNMTAWVAGATASAGVATSLTGKKVVGANDCERLTKSAQEEAVTAGYFIFKVDKAGNVTCVYDINTLTEITPEKGKQFRKNRFVRLIGSIRQDINTVFESNFMGKINNNETGRALFKSALVDYFKELERMGAIENFTPEDIVIRRGEDNDAVIVDVAIKSVDAVEKVYMTVVLS